MEELTRSVKQKIFTVLVNQPDFLGVYDDYDGILTFLTKIWPLHEMPSEDERFQNAYEDARQHLVNNSDWDYEQTFIERFKLIDGSDDVYKRFLEVTVSPEIRREMEYIVKYVTLINENLRGTEWNLVHVDYFEELPVYKLLKADTDVNLPLELRSNKIPFFKIKEQINEYPCFYINYDTWNDFGIMTLVGLSYLSSENKTDFIGRVKIMKRDEQDIWDQLPDKFISLDHNFCSLAQTEDYYRELKALLPKSYQSALYSLRDVAFFPKIAEEFEDDDVFRRSLLRNNEAERIMRTMRFILNNIDLSQAFKFNYLYKPPYAENEINLNFDFQYEGLIKHRVYGLIGKNGTGKTRILSSLANALSKDSSPSITPKKPIYGKVFSVSYSFFDQFEIPSANSSFNYVYCGLKKKNGGWLSESELLSRFFLSAKRIQVKNEVDSWHSVLSAFISEEIISELFQYDRFENAKFNREGFTNAYQKLSSGQNILLFILTEVIAQIRFNSLILYDEPETHLHPNAISELMNTIFTMVDRFESFCIIATHSPIVIQELQSRNIYVVERDDNFANLRKLEKEAFGENLTIITEDIFGNREIAKHFIKTLKSLVEMGKSFEEIVELLETEELPLSLNARLYIKTLIAEQNEESGTLS